MIRAAAFAAVLAAALPAAAERWYAIHLDGQLAGYAIYQEERPTGKAGETVIKGETRLAFETAEGQGMMEVVEETRLAGGRPVRHKIESRRGHASEEVEIEFEADRARLVLREAAGQIRLSVPLPVGAIRGCGPLPTYRDLRGIGTPGRIQLFDPATRRVELVAVTPRGVREERREGRPAMIGAWDLSWGKRSERVELDMATGWPLRIERTGPVRSTLVAVGPEIAAQAKALLLVASPFFRRAPPDAPGRPVAFRILLRGTVVAQGRWTLVAGEAPAAYELSSDTVWSRPDKSQPPLALVLKATFRADLAPIEVRRNRSGGGRPDQALYCRFEERRIVQISSTAQGTTSAETPSRGPTGYVDSECPSLLALLAGQLPHEPEASVTWRVYDAARMRVGFLKVSRLAAEAGDRDLLRFRLAAPEGERLLATDGRGRFQWMAWGQWRVERQP